MKVATITLPSGQKVTTRRTKKPSRAVIARVYDTTHVWETQRRFDPFLGEMIDVRVEVGLRRTSDRPKWSLIDWAYSDEDADSLRYGLSLTPEKYSDIRVVPC